MRWLDYLGTPLCGQDMRWGGGEAGVHPLERPSAVSALM